MLRSVPVNLSLNAEHLDTKQEQYREGGSVGGAVAVVKTEVQVPVYMNPGGPYRPEEQIRVVYEQQNNYDGSMVSHGGYMKDDQRSTPDSTYEDHFEQEVRTWVRRECLKGRLVERCLT